MHIIWVYVSVHQRLSVHLPTMIHLDNSLYIYITACSMQKLLQNCKAKTEIHTIPNFPNLKALLHFLELLLVLHRCLGSIERRMLRKSIVFPPERLRVLLASCIMANLTYRARLLRNLHREAET